MKAIAHVRRPAGQHWVGDGFPVHTLFSPGDAGERSSPFLMLDYAPPTPFTPTSHRRGVGVHPHRGFETVTLVYQGGLAHRDSSGGGGEIGPGDVQWMTAGAGILHEEFHSEAFSRSGGTLEMAQLWVNLPARAKRVPPAYQTLLDAEMPRVELPDGAGWLRVVAGHYAGQQGPARTHSPIEVWDLTLNRDARVTLPAAEGRSGVLVVRRGTVQVNGEAIVRAGEAVLFDTASADVALEANTTAELLWLSGEPLNEPIAAYGPFVMNTQAEIAEALDDYHRGAFGQLAS
jgi:quercetin 2,3-dioxygenase